MEAIGLGFVVLSLCTRAVSC